MATPAEIPQDLTTLDDEALASLESDLDARAEELYEASQERTLTDDEIREAEAIAASRDAIEVEAGRRATEAEERQARQDDVLARARRNAGDAEAEAEPVVDEADAPADDEVLVPAAADTDAPAEEPVAAAVEPEAAAPAPVVTPDVAPAAAAARPARRVRAADIARPKHAAPRASASAGFVASEHAVPAVRAGHQFANMADLAAAMTKRRYGWGTIPAGERTFVPMATADLGIEVEVSAEWTENLPTFRAIQADAASRLAAAAPTSGLVASGPFCTPLTPIYDFFRLASSQSPVEDSLPVVNAPRGGIRYIPGTCDVSEAEDGVGQFAYNHDYDEDGEKPCVTLECPTLEDAYVRAITSCVRFGNLQYRTFPEQVADFQENLAILFQEEKEVYYLDTIDTNSTLVTGYAPYGASRGVLFDLVLAGAAYRKRQRMARNATLAVYLPDWLPDLIKVDIALDGDRPDNWVNVSDADVNAMLARHNLSPVWYSESATGRGQAWRTAQAAGNLNKWPQYIHSYIFAPGTFVRLDGGTLDVGLVRDSTLNRTNDFEMFMEEWIGLAMLGCESIHLVTDPCPTGARPDYATVIGCTTYA